MTQLGGRQHLACAAPICRHGWKRDARAVALSSPPNSPIALAGHTHGTTYANRLGRASGARATTAKHSIRKRQNANSAGRHQHLVNHLNDAVRLRHVGNRDIRGSAFLSMTIISLDPFIMKVTIPS
jgi:hypothetical protein